MMKADYRTADFVLLCHKLRSFAAETDDSDLMMTGRLAALIIEKLVEELAAERGQQPKTTPYLTELATQVYRAGETLYIYNLIDGDHIRFDHLYEASRILRALKNEPTP